MDDRKLIAEAKRVREFAYVPYSHFAVGAAVQGGTGRVYGGCNIENHSLSLTNCAEATAIYKAISEGERELLTILILTDAVTPTPPCGRCRQIILEFRIPRIVMRNLNGDSFEMTLNEILPEAFSAADIYVGAPPTIPATANND